MAMLGHIVQMATDRRFVFPLSHRQVERKFRLFYCACARLRWNTLANDSVRQAIEVIEQYALGRASCHALARARRTALEAARQASAATPIPIDPTDSVSFEAIAAARLVVSAAQAQRALLGYGFLGGWPVAEVDQAAIVRDLVADPSELPSVSPRWLTTTVVDLSGFIQSRRAFELMPVLGDSLQDAGCDRDEVLDHCYGPGPHFLGCHILELFSGPGNG